MKTIPIFGTTPEHRELRELLAGTPDKYEARKVARFFCKYNLYKFYKRFARIPKAIELNYGGGEKKAQCFSFRDEFSR